MKEKCVIFDIDGTLANLDHRLHHLKGIKIDCECINQDYKEQNLFCDKCNYTGVIGKPDWDAFQEKIHEDTPVKSIIKLLHLLSEEYKIFYCTGRPTTYELATKSWLIEYVSYHEHELFMRPEGDFRSDFIIKREMLYKIKEDYEIIMAFEDRDRCVKMYRDEGIVCLQVKEGSY